MTVDELLQRSKCDLSDIARILGVTAPACYKWKKSGNVPPLRLYELKEKKPEWFEEPNNG
jgi:predicted transcriptional regulator